MSELQNMTNKELLSAYARHVTWVDRGAPTVKKELLRRMTPMPSGDVADRLQARADMLPKVVEAFTLALNYAERPTHPADEGNMDKIESMKQTLADAKALMEVNADAVQKKNG